MELDANTIMQLGVGGIFAILVLREAKNVILAILDKSNGKSVKGDDKELVRQFEELMKKTVDTIEANNREIHDLHTWHNVRGGDGSFVWYDKSHALKDALGELASAISEQTKFLGNVDRAVSDVCKETERLSRIVEGGMK